MSDGSSGAANDVKADDAMIAMLRESVDAFVRQAGGQRISRRFLRKLPGYDPDLIAEMARLGWFGLLAPESVGGSALGFRALSVVLTQLGARLMGEPLVAVMVLAGRTLEHCPEGPLRTALLSKLAVGEALPALAWQESPGELNSTAVASTLSGAGANLRLNARKRFCAGAGAASGFIVSCMRGEEPALVWVPADTAGLTQNVSWRPDGAPFVDVAFENVAIPSTQLLSHGPTAQHALKTAIAEAAIMASSELAGLSQACLAMTLEHLSMRKQYGKRIGSFQALQHKAVDLFVQQSLANAVADEAASALDNQVTGPQLARTAARAKARCSDVALRVTRESIQLHGAIGYTDEFDLGLYLKRALTLSAWLGNAAAQRKLYSKLRNAP